MIPDSADDRPRKLKRARNTALTLAVISILMTLYAIVQKSMAEAQTERVYSLEQELEECQNSK